MSKRGKGSKRYQPAPWEADFSALERGGVAPWSRKPTGKAKRGKGDSAPRGGGR